MATTTQSPAGTEHASLSGSLGVTAIVFMVVAAAAPLTVIGGGTPVGLALGNGVGFPANYVLAAVILILFSVGMSAMSRRISKPGAFFTYIGAGLSRSLGVGAAFVALVAYTAVQLAVYGFLGEQLHIAAASAHLPSPPWWVWAFVIIALVGWLGYHNIDLSTKVLGVALVAEVLIVLILDVVVLATGGAQGISGESFTPHAALSGNPGVGLTFAIAGFIGFEATAIFRDEARDPERTVPRATYAAIILIGAFYALSAWALVLAVGPSKIVAAAQGDPSGLMVATTNRYLGGFAAGAVQVLMLSSAFACVLSFHNVLARYMHAMGQTKVLPGPLAEVHKSFGSPARSSIVQSITSAVLVGASVLVGLDPITQVFSWFSGLAVLGVLVLMALTSIAVIVYFRHDRSDRRPWNTIIAPVLATIGLMGLTLVVAVNFPVLIGGDVGLAVGLALVIVLALIVGIGVALSLKRKHPEIYENVVDAIAS